jgi:hypothetical protein
MQQRMDSASQIWPSTTRCCALDWCWLSMKGEFLTLQKDEVIKQHDG